MQKYIHKLVILLSWLSVLALISACNASGVGTIPSGTPDHGNGTPAVLPTPDATPLTVPTAAPTAKGAYYAFVRNNQLWVALNGATPVQMTHFDYTNLPNVFWHQPLWSSDDHFMAFIMNAFPVGLGGGGCPGPDYSANGALYVLNTASGQLTKLFVATNKADPLVASAHNGYWQYVFWQDATHLLAWYNGVIGKASSTAGLYRYDLNSSNLMQIVPLSSLGVSTLYTVQKGVPLLLSLRYSNGQLFYQVVVHALEQRSQLIIYHHSVIHPELPSNKVLEMGSEPWCAGQQNGAYSKPGWDVSPDGEQVAAQMIVAASANQGLSSIQVMNLSDGAATGLLTRVDAQMLAHDMILTWGPDSQTLVASASHMFSQAGPYSATLANPTALQKYTPSLAGQVSWRADSSAFALENASPGDVTSTNNLYLFTPGDTQGRLLLTDAQNFVWG